MSTNSSASAEEAQAALHAQQMILGETIGALEIGVLLSAILFGVVCIQIHYYFRKFPRDSLAIKLMVSFIGLLELIHTLCICVELYTATVVFYGRIEEMHRWPSQISSMIPSALIAITTQIFFVNRIQRFSGHYLIPFLCISSCLVRISFTIAGTYRAFQAVSLMAFMTEYSWLLSVVLSLSGAVDLLIAAALTYTLTNHKGQSIKRSERVIDSLIRWSIQNGLLTSLSSVAVVICFQTMPHNFIFIAVYAVVARFYSISLLSSLNSRAKLRKTIGLSEAMIMTPTDSTGRSRNSGRFPTSSQPLSPLVFETTKSVRVDPSPAYCGTSEDCHQTIKRDDCV